MISSVEGLMMGKRLLSAGSLHSPSMNSCRVGIGIAIFHTLSGSPCVSVDTGLSLFLQVAS
jgi:hypothetical protein